MTSTVSAIAFLALALSVFAVIVCGYLLVRTSRDRRSSRRSARRPARRGTRRPSSTGKAASGLAAEVADLRDDMASALRHLAVVRYDAFGDMGGHLSWSLALLDAHGDGVVVTSIHGRSDARTYAKNITDWSSNQQLSPEEEQAIDFAHGKET
jgi:uncharacterized protein YlxW (UPF0749 family)